jgi:hypothetical protein
MSKLLEFISKVFKKKGTTLNLFIIFTLVQFYDQISEVQACHALGNTTLTVEEFQILLSRVVLQVLGSSDMISYSQCISGYIDEFRLLLDDLSKSIESDGVEKGKIMSKKVTYLGISPLFDLLF